MVKYIYNLIARASYLYIISGLSNLLFSQYAAHENCIITLTLYPVLVIKDVKALNYLISALTTEL